MRCALLTADNLRHKYFVSKISKVLGKVRAQKKRASSDVYIDKPENFISKFEEVYSKNGQFDNGIKINKKINIKTLYIFKNK